MTTKHPAGDPRALWQQQAMDKSEMSVEVLLERAQDVAMRTRRQIVLPVILAGLTTVLGVARFSEGLPSTLSTVVWVSILILLWVWPVRMAYTAYRIHRWVWPGDLDPEVALTQSITFYERELRRQQARTERRFRVRGIVVTAVVLLASVAAFALIRNVPIASMIPIVILVAAWVGMSLYARKHETRRIAREIDALRRFESEPEG